MVQIMYTTHVASAIEIRKVCGCTSICIRLTDHRKTPTTVYNCYIGANFTLLRMRSSEKQVFFDFPGRSFELMMQPRHPPSNLQFENEMYPQIPHNMYSNTLWTVLLCSYALDLSPTPIIPLVVVGVEATTIAYMQ